jgi:hypothetical protein
MLEKSSAQVRKRAGAASTRPAENQEVSAARRVWSIAGVQVALKQTVASRGAGNSKGPRLLILQDAAEKPRV